jgi:SAM-dependent methyltransferase
VALTSIELAADPAPLPAAARQFLHEAMARTAAFFARPGVVPGAGFLPSDYELVYRTLRALRAQEPQARTFCEWGSGFGAVAGLAAQLGYAVHGIEIDAELVAHSRALLGAFGLPVEVVQGSFVPADYALGERLSDLDTRTVMTGPDAYADMEMALDDFEVVFAYPWPTEEDQYRAMFHRGADYGAVLLTYSSDEGMRGYRKVPGRRR